MSVETDPCGDAIAQGGKGERRGILISMMIGILTRVGVVVELVFSAGGVVSWIGYLLAAGVPGIADGIPVRLVGLMLANRAGSGR